MFGFKDVNAYLEYIGYDQKKLHENFLKKSAIVATHDAPSKVAEIQRVGGGTDNANPGKNIRMGGFGDMPSLV